MALLSAFSARSTAAEVAAGHDLRGKAALITGAASGIGVETARALLGAGARVLLAVRDSVRGEAVAAELRASTGHLQAEVVTLDLGSLASVRAAAAEILRRTPRLDYLINNAGVVATPFSQTADGFELQFGTNHLGHFLLFEQLRPALVEHSRVVALSSLGHRRSDIRLDDLNYRHTPYDKWQAYGNSKTANALFAWELARRYGEQGLRAFSVNPGGIMTGLQKHLPLEEQRAMGWIDEQGRLNPVFKTPEQGAATTVWAALAPELEAANGIYLEDCQEALPFDAEKPFGGYMPYLRDSDKASQLWEKSEALVAGTA